jgi:hypothetical protein
MFSGIQEILIVALIISGLFLVPRIRKPQAGPSRIIFQRPDRTLSWTLRLAIVLSVLWPVAWALFFKPWQHNGVVFATVGIGPVVVGWSLRWVLAGLKNRRRNENGRG